MEDNVAVGACEYRFDGNRDVSGELVGGIVLEVSDYIFYFLGFISLFFATALIVSSNPIYSALSLVITMICASFLYMGMEAYFIAAVQLIVYAGAVMVLFVMVVMLFDLKHEMKTFSQNKIGLFLRLGLSSILLGFLFVAVRLGFSIVGTRDVVPTKIISTKEIAIQLFGKYVFGFEAISILLLVVAVGVVSISRSKGGTHAER